MNCMEIKTDVDMKLYQAMRDIANMEESEHKHQIMYVMFDVARRLRENVLVLPLNEVDVFAEYGIIIENGKIVDYGNISIDTWKNKLLNDFNINGKIKTEHVGITNGRGKFKGYKGISSRCLARLLLY